MHQNRRLTAANRNLLGLDVETTAQTFMAYFEGVLSPSKTQNDTGVVKNLAWGAAHLVEEAAPARLYK